MGAHGSLAPELETGLRSALARSGNRSGVALQPLPDKGLAHLHVRLLGTGVLARIPKQSQIGLDAQANLRHEAACFGRAAPSGHTPRLVGTLAVSRELPHGALLVEEIVGRVAALPSDLVAIARCLGAIHSMPVPVVADRGPLASPRDPLRALVEEVDAQAVHLRNASAGKDVLQRIEAELNQMHRQADAESRPGVHLVSFDTHPGNFVVRAQGSAVLVDLEKCRYSYPGLDLAHATLYTSTTWDVASRASLPLSEVISFYRAWENGVGADVAARARPWHVALRRAMWLWSITWCCKWRVLSREPRLATPAGEDWSADNSDAQLITHVRERVHHYLSPGAILRVQRELEALHEALVE